MAGIGGGALFPVEMGEAITGFEACAAVYAGGGGMLDEAMGAAAEADEL